MTLPPFQQLVDEHGQRLTRFLISSVGPHAASDLEQETWLAALRAYPGLRRADNLGGWLITIAHHKVVDRWRMNGREVVTDAPPDRAEPGPEPPDDALWRAVDGLPDRQRSAVLLRYVADLTYRNVGEVLDCTEAAARQRVQAALKTLRQEVGR